MRQWFSRGTVVTIFGFIVYESRFVKAVGASLDRQLVDQLGGNRLSEIFAERRVVVALGFEIFAGPFISAVEPAVMLTLNTNRAAVAGRHTRKAGRAGVIGSVASLAFDIQTIGTAGRQGRQ